MIFKKVIKLLHIFREKVFERFYANFYQDPELFSFLQNLYLYKLIAAAEIPFILLNYLSYSCSKCILFKTHALTLQIL